MLASLQWKYHWKAPDNAKLLKGDKLPDSVLKLLDQAESTELKLSQESMRLIKKVEDGSQEFKQLKSAYTESQQHLQDLRHIRDFRELPHTDSALTKQSFDKCMSTVPWSRSSNLFFQSFPINLFRFMYYCKSHWFWPLLSSTLLPAIAVAHTRWHRTRRSSTS